VFGSYTDRDFVLTPAELQQAMDAYRPMPYTPWWAISTLRPSLPPVRSSKPVSDAATPSESTAASDVIVASESITATGAGNPARFGNLPQSDSARGVAVQLDIRFWRGRWWWRLVVRAAVRFFRP
jgi:hypothetical protein